MATEYGWLADFRILILLSVFLILGVFFARTKVALFVLYVLFFPALVAIWKVPAMLLRVGSWVLGIAALNALIGSFIGLRRRLIAASIYIASAIILASLTNEIVLWCGVVLMLFAITNTYVSSFIISLRPPAVIRLYRHWIEKLSDHLERSTQVDQEFTGLPALRTASGELTPLANTLQNVVLYNRGRLFAAQRLQEYQKSQAGIISGTLGAMYLVSATLLAFYFVYVGLLKLVPSQFNDPDLLSHFDLLRASFDSMIFGGSTEWIFITGWPAAVSMYQRLLSALIVLVFATLIISAKNRKYHSEIDDTVQQIRASGEVAEDRIRRDFRYDSVEDAIADLVEVKAAFASFIVRLSNSVSSRSRRASSDPAPGGQVESSPAEPSPTPPPSSPPASPRDTPRT